ncbi:MAG: hypothetical protein KDB68_09685 [Planctomycetes bacterium]|nr:hypothetical protein [Planctomycetota bacterium]
MKAPLPAPQPDEEKHEMPYFNLGHLDIPRSAVEGKDPERVLQVICTALAEATRSSLADITLPEEIGFVVNRFERCSTPFIKQWDEDQLPPPIGPYLHFSHETAKAICLMLSADGPLQVNSAVAAGRETPIAAERLWQDCHVWLIASEAWAALSFAKTKLDRDLKSDRMVLQFNEDKLAHAKFLLDIVNLNPAVPDDHVPDMSRFHKLVDTPESREEVQTILKAIYGIELWPLRVLFKIVRAQQKGKLAGEVGLYELGYLADLIQGAHGKSGADPADCRRFVDNAMEEWTAASKAYRDSCFDPKSPWLKVTPRAFAMLPVIDRGTPMAMMCASATDMTVYEIGHDAMRGGLEVPADVAEIRRRLQARGSTHLAWYQLQFAGIEKPDNSNKVFGDRYACYVAEGKQLGGVGVPPKYDDLDLVVFDRVRKQVTVCECKYASAAVRTPEFRDEFDFFDKSGVTWKKQLQPRINWVREYLHQMKIDGWEDTLAGWSVEGCILTNIAPRALLAAYGDLPGTRAVGSAAVFDFLFG